MKAYLITTGTVFGLLALAHVWRVIGESRSLAVDPWLVAITLISAGMSVWAFRLLKTSKQ
jgi:N-acetylglutamate synthase-like GNAT family acetyltransferase